MKFVSAARLRKAQDRVVAARPYARQILAVIQSLAARVGERGHPLLAERGNKRIELLVITADRGCVGLQHQHPAHAMEFIASHEGHDGVDILGKKARDFFRRRPSRCAGSPPASCEPDVCGCAVISQSGR
jgi:F-type H+-transporting ATPase subunit gamma